MMRIKKIFLFNLILFFGLQSLYAQELMKVFTLDENGKLIQMKPAKVAGMKQKKSTFGTLMVGNFAKSSVAVSYEGKQSNVSIHPDNALFYIYLPEGVDYKEICVGKLKVSKNERDLTIIEGNGFTNKQKKSENISLQKISNQIYALRIGKDFKNGDYAICQSPNGYPQVAYDFCLDNTIPSVYIPNPNPEDLIALLTNSSVSNFKQESEKPRKPLDNKFPISDVDINIPENKTINASTFAIIIANENYARVEEVPFAKNDGEVIKEYFMKSLGIPEKNINYFENATLNDMKFAINRMKDIDNAFDGDCSFIVYYSGHGIPDENSLSGYLLPIDGYGNDLTTAYSLNDLYDNLSTLNSKWVLLMLDACFSGASREGKMLLSSRGIAIKPKQVDPKGSLIILSASQGDETAFPYKEKSHGMFTYFILKKFQEKSGDVTIGELADYVINQVKRTSIIENGKPQTPEFLYSKEQTENWMNIKLQK